MSDREPFVMVPVRLVRRLDDEAITIAQLGLAAALRYREWRDSGASFTLAELKDWLGYDAGTEQLRRDLHALDYGTLTPPAPGKGRWKWSSGGAAGGDPGGESGGGQLHPGSTETAIEQAQTSIGSAIAPDPTSTQVPPADGPLEVEAAAEVEEVSSPSTVPLHVAHPNGTAKAESSGPLSLAAAAEPASEQDLDEACRRFGASRNIVIPIVEGFTRADLAHVIDTMERRLQSGNVRDTPALFVSLVRARDKDRRIAIVPALFEQPTVDDELERYAADLLRQGHPVDVVKRLTEMRRLKLTASPTQGGTST